MSDCSDKPVVGRCAIGPVTDAVPMPGINGPISIFQGHTYSHMCRDGHTQIGHRDSGADERCPYCRAIDLLLWVRDQSLGDDVAEAIDTWIVQDGIDRGADSAGERDA